MSGGGIVTRRSYKKISSTTNENKPGNMTKQSSISNTRPGGSGASKNGQNSQQKDKKEKDVNGKRCEGTNVGEVVYLEPQSYEDQTKKHPVDVGKALSETGIRNYTDIQAIGRFRFKVSFRTEDEARKLTKVNLSKHNLKCFLPFTMKQTIGLIKGVPLEYSEAEIEESMEAEIRFSKVERVRRKVEDQLVETRNVKVTFTGKDLPDRVAIYGCIFRVELYLFPVKQCRNCWGFGHNAAKCIRKKKCATCGNVEHEGDCEQQKCLNCKGNHRATDFNCPERQKQKHISQAMQKDKLTYKEAKDKCTIRNGYEVLTDAEGEFPQLRTQNNQRSQGSAQYRTVVMQTKQQGRDHRVAYGNNRTQQETTVPDIPHVFEANPYRTNEFERFTRNMELFLKNIGVMQKLLKLQAGINAELIRDNTEHSMEELLLRISTSLKEVIDDFAGNLNALMENKEKEQEEENNNNGA